MNRLFVFLAIVALVIALPVTHEAFAGNNNTKVEICHVNSANSPGIESSSYYENYFGYVYAGSYTYTYHLGKVIEVDESAVDAHVAHGDSTRFYDLDEWLEDYLTSLEDYNGYYSYDYRGYPYYWNWYGWYEYDNVNAVIKNANCYWSSYSN